MITQERVHQLFSFNAETGHLVWKARPVSEFPNRASQRSFCVRCEGKLAGHNELQGYRKIVVDGKKLSAHRLIWLYVYGEWLPYPEIEIDHINGQRHDNRLENLRKVTKSENQRNAAMRVTNVSGVTGVNWQKGTQRWVARIWDGPRHVHLGSFADLEAARAVRLAAEQRLGYSATHGREPYQAESSRSQALP